MGQKFLKRNNSEHFSLDHCSVVVWQFRILEQKFAQEFNSRFCSRKAIYILLTIKDKYEAIC